MTQTHEASVPQTIAASPAPPTDPTAEGPVGRSTQQQFKLVKLGTVLGIALGISAAVMIVVNPTLLVRIDYVLLGTISCGTLGGLFAALSVAGSD